MAQPPPNISTNAPSRNPPNVVRKRRFLFWSDTATQDELEEYLQPKAQLDKRIPELLHDYLLFKNQVLKQFDLMVLFAICQPTGTPPSIERKTSFETDSKFTSCLERLREEMKAANDAELSFCAISPTIEKDMSSIFPFKVKIFGSLSRLRRRYEAPRLSILYTVADEWDVPDDVLEECMSNTKSDEQRLVPYTDFSMQTKPVKDFSLDDPKWFSIELRWHCEVPKYQGDFYMYIWQLHIELPNPEMATVYINKSSGNRWKVLIAWKLTDKTSNYLPEAWLREREAKMATAANTGHAISTEIISSILSIYTLLIADTGKFRDALLEQISVLKLLGRRWPSGNKMNFLLHLDDCRQESCIGLRDATNLLQQIANYIDRIPTTVDPALQDSCKKLIQVLERLQTELADVGGRLAEVRTMIKEQIDLRQITLTGILAFLAAIYLPFSLISGIFGMNVKDPLWNVPKPATNVSSSSSGLPTSTAADDVTESYRTIVTASNNIRALSTLKPALLVQNSTTNATASAANTDSSGLTLSDVNATIIAALANQPSSHLWSFRQYWYIAVAVTAVTIFFPLIAGPVFRATIRFSYRSQGYWRTAVFLLGLSVALIMDTFIPQPWLPLALGMPQVLVAVWKLVRAHLRESHKKRWLGYTSVLVACIFFDVGFPFNEDYTYYYSYSDSASAGFSPGFGLTGILPPAYLFVVWVQTGKPLLSRARWDEITAQLPRWLVWVNLPRLIERREDNKAYTGHKKLVKGIFIVAAGVCNSVGSYYIPASIYSGLTTTPLALYSLDKLINSSKRQRHRRKWTFFAAVAASSILLWWYTFFGVVIGSIGLFPTLTLWAFANEAKVISILRKFIPKKRSSLPTAIAVNPDPGMQMSTLSSPLQ